MVAWGSRLADAAPAGRRKLGVLLRTGRRRAGDGSGWPSHSAGRSVRANGRACEDGKEGARGLGSSSDQE